MTQIKVAVVMGSKSDWPTMQYAVEVLETLQIDYEVKVVSAHRTPDLLASFAKSAADRGVHIIIAGAGGAAHLPGMLAAYTPVPVMGVPVESKALQGMDSLLSIVQMPGGVPVSCMAIGKAGAKNAAIMAAQILGLQDPQLMTRLMDFRHQQTQQVLEFPDPRDAFKD